MKHYNDLVRRVKREFDWDSYVKEHYTVKYTPSDELRICCFVCGEDKFKLYVNPVKKTFCCFKCDFSMKNYDVIDFVAKTENLTRFQALQQLVREYARVTPPDEEWETQVKTGVSTEEVAQPRVPIKTLSGLPKGLVPLTETAEDSDLWWNYLIDRGLTHREISAMNIHYTPEKSLPVLDAAGKKRGDAAKRVIIPVYGGNHQLVSWQGRSIDPKCPKSDRYLTAPESDLSKTLWPYVKPFDKHAVLVEGIFDALAVRRVPNVSVYATFSKKISMEQILLLKSWGIEEITLFWDKRDAKPDMIRAVKELHMHFRRVYVLNMRNWPQEKDAGNMLADPQGAVTLKETLEDRVDTYDTLEFTKWQLVF